ncbi:MULTISPECIES: hypothetical protein [Amycolatopsis]|uniref:hypothetical protein n=1 Tax=Amycolatopsis TaxID=1813 RepID=UPI000B8B56ED|nr:MULTISPECIES: hypothetical protein [Amycolatopsis]OXM72926.1 hypothetical protein CF166_13050 [Amycolatopsis sp. KNN50.9b]
MTSSPPEQPSESKTRTATVNLPFVRAEFRAPHVPGRGEVTAALHTARSFLPPPRQLAYWGGLGLLAAVELIEWPVAVAIGVGTAIAGRGKGAAPRQAEADPAEANPTEVKPAEVKPVEAKPAKARAGTQKRGPRGGA